MEKIQWPSSKKSTYLNEVNPSSGKKSTTDFEYTHSKVWLVQIPILVFLVYMTIRHVSDSYYQNILLYFLSMFIHEGGHILFMLFGKTLWILGGTIVQVLMPILWIIHFYRLSKYFSAVVCFGWLGDSLFGVGRYLGDARAGSLALLGAGMSDWRYLLGEWGILQYDTVIASYIRIIAILCMLFSISFGIWIIWLEVAGRNHNKKIATD